MFETIRLQNFRSYQEANFKLSGEVNVVAGPNASGKTNLLEAFLVLARGRSYRNKLPQLVRFGATWFRLDARAAKSSRVLKFNNGAEFTIDHKKFKRLPAGHQLPIVLFEPNHLLLLTGGPTKRREWLDEMLVVKSPTQKKLISSYKRTLAQRNNLLKKSLPLIRKQIFAWDVRLSELAGEIAKSRQLLIDDINQRISQPYHHISGASQQIALRYDSVLPISNYSTKMIEKLNHELDNDIRLGFTGSGPHREDFSTHLNNKPIVEAGSRGEVRSLLISLKLIEKDWLEEAMDQKPALLLDDVFSELDSQRRTGLVDYLKKHQTIITTTDADLTKKYFKNQQLIKLS